MSTRLFPDELEKGQRLLGHAWLKCHKLEGGTVPQAYQAQGWFSGLVTSRRRNVLALEKQIQFCLNCETLNKQLRLPETLRKHKRPLV